MAFINERISKEHTEKYDLERLKNRLNGLGNPSRQWTVEIKREIWLRLFYAQHDHTTEPLGLTGKKIWDYYWKGTLMSVETFDEVTKPESENNGLYYAYLRLTAINIPAHLIPRQAMILQDLKQSFIAYAGAGIYSNAVNCQIDFEYKGVLI